MLYRGYNDYELIYMVKENCDDYRGILYDKYSSILKSISYEYYSKFKNYGFDYDDFLQEAYIAFERAIIKYDDNNGALFYTFVVLCVRRSLISFCRSITNNKHISCDNLVSIDEISITDSKYDVDNLFDYFELVDKIKNILYSLPIEISTIMELRLNNFSFSEISILLDLPVSTVEFRNRRVKKEVNRLLSTLR